MFQQPRENSAAPLDEMIGALCLFVVHAYKTGINTSFGDDKDAVEVDLHCLDGRHGGEVFPGALLFQGALIGALKGAAGGDPVLGRLGQGQAKPKQNPPYVLLPFTGQDAAVAGPYWQAHTARKMQQPAAPAAPQAPVQQQYQTPAPVAAAPTYPAAASPAAASAPVAPPAPASAPAAPAPGGVVTADVFITYPPEVQALLRAQGLAPAGV
jgi:hypothetical protein